MLFLKHEFLNIICEINQTVIMFFINLFKGNALPCLLMYYIKLCYIISCDFDFYNIIYTCEEPYILDSR